MPAELCPLAYYLSGGRLLPEIAIALVVNVGGTLACVAGLRWVLRDVDGVPTSVLAWPWEPEAWGINQERAAVDASGADSAAPGVAAQGQAAAKED